MTVKQWIGNGNRMDLKKLGIEDRRFVHVYSKHQLFKDTPCTIFKNIKGKIFSPIMNYSLFPLFGQYVIIRASNDGSSD